MPPASQPLRHSRLFGVGVFAPLFGPRLLRSKATRGRAAKAFGEAFAKSKQRFLIRVIRGLNFGCGGAALGHLRFHHKNVRCGVSGVSSAASY